MIKVGHDLSDLEIEQRYTVLAGSLAMPEYFYPAVAEFADLRSTTRILDIGCGDGGLLLEVIKRAGASLYVGVELSIGRLRLAQERLGNPVGLLQIDGRAHLPFGDQSFDLIFITEVIEHLKDPGSLLNEVHRILKSSGRLILTTPNSDAYPFWQHFACIAEHIGYSSFIKYFLPFEHPSKTKQPIDTVLSFDEVQSILQSAGFMPDHVTGKETLPFLFTAPGFRGLSRRGFISQSFVDYVFNQLGLTKRGYRVFWDCVKKEPLSYAAASA
jgi:SAM-dependent methyltransferase